MPAPAARLSTLGRRAVLLGAAERAHRQAFDLITAVAGPDGHHLGRHGIRWSIEEPSAS